MTIFEEAAKTAAEMRYGDLSPRFVEAIKIAVYDWIGVTIAASQEREAKILYDYIADTAAKPSASVLGTALRTSVGYAALANGMAGHLMDYDDNGALVGHPANIISAALFAAAETVPVSGRDLLLAYAAGYQICNCLIEPIERKAWFNSWHLTPVAGIFGAVTAAGLVLGLTEHQLCMAYGIAASQSSGFQANYGTPVKSFQVGMAAQKAIQAVELAKRGMTSSPAAAETDGWYKCYSGEQYHEGMRPTFALKNGMPNVDPFTQIKPYPCCGGGHTFLESAIKVAKEYDLNPDDIDRVVVGTDRGGPHMLMVHIPQDVVAARFSGEFMACAPLVYRTGGIDLFTEQVLRDEQVQRLMHRCTCVIDPELAGDDSGWHPSRLQVFLKDGRAITRVCMASKGTPDDPMTEEDILGKFAECTKSFRGGRWYREIWEDFQTMEGMDNTQMFLAKLHN